jgi:hypothetical protein
MSFNYAAFQHRAIMGFNSEWQYFFLTSIQDIHCHAPTAEQLDVRCWPQVGTSTYPTDIRLLEATAKFQGDQQTQQL